MDFSFIKEDDLKKRFAKITIKNAYIKHLDIEVIGHYGNIVTLDAPVLFDGNKFSNPLGLINFTRGCGNVIRTLFYLLDIGREDGCKLSDLKDIPCRIVMLNCEIVGIGHLISDRFLLKKDLINWLNEVEK